MIQIPQSTSRRVLLKLYLTGTTTAATSKTLAITLSKTGGAFANPSAGATNATELSNGWYYVDLSITDTNTLGDLIVRGTATGCDDSERLFGIVLATNGGLTNLDVVTSTRLAPTVSGRTLNVNTSGHGDSNIQRWGNNPVDPDAIPATAANTPGGLPILGGASLLGVNLLKINSGTYDVAGLGVLSDDYLNNGVIPANVTAWRGNLVNVLIAGRVDSNIGATQSGVVPTVAQIAAQITTDHGVGSYIRNTEPTTPPTTTEIKDAIFSGGDVDGYTLEETLKLCMAALAGKLSGAATTTITIRAADDSKGRIVATVDSNGNRTAVTLDATG